MPLGRLTVPKKQPGKVNFGIHQTMPLVETRVDFSLQTWELDNLGRGAKDIDLAPVVEACRESAAFEEAAVFDGFEAGGMSGLHQAVKGKELRLPLEVNAVVDAVAEARGRLLSAGVEGPASLVVSPALCKFLSHGTQGGTLRGIIERHMGVPVIYSAAVKDALMVGGARRRLRTHRRPGLRHRLSQPHRERDSPVRGRILRLPGDRAGSPGGLQAGLIGRAARLPCRSRAAPPPHPFGAAHSGWLR